MIQAVMSLCEQWGADYQTVISADRHHKYVRMRRAIATALVLTGTPVTEAGRIINRERTTVLHLTGVLNTRAYKTDEQDEVMLQQAMQALHHGRSRTKAVRS